MKVLVVGLGLIGGSLCKAMKKYTSHFVVGCDLNHDIEFSALRDVAIDMEFDGNYSGFDLVIVSLFPEAAEKYIMENAGNFDKNTLITDVCGIKGDFSLRMKKMAEENKILQKNRQKRAEIFIKILTIPLFIRSKFNLNLNFEIVENSVENV